MSTAPRQAVETPPPPRRGAAAYAREARPRQWIKNGLVFTAPVFGGTFLSLGSDARAAAAAIAFCALSSAVYVFNDTIDVQADRAHPTKRLRPIAAGIIPMRNAEIFTATLVLLGIALLSGLGTMTVLTGLVFLAVNAVYSLWLKRLFLLDSFGVAAGFVLRVGAGAFVVDRSVSPWVIVLLVLVTLFMSLGKRRGELTVLGPAAASHKAVLGHYTQHLIDQFTSILVACMILAYMVWGYLGSRGVHALMLTVVFVVYGLFRYLFLLENANGHENPDELLVADLPTILNLGAWVASVAVIVAVQGGLR